MALTVMATYLLLFLNLPLTLGFPGSELMNRNDVCHSGLYGVAVEVLSSYGPALQ